MSQHHFFTKLNGESVSVLMGWDRPLQGFFLVVVPDDQPDDFIYSNLCDEELTECCGLPDNLDHFKSELQKMGIVVPLQMLAAIEQDGIANTGNRNVVWNIDGTIHNESNGR